MVDSGDPDETPVGHWLSRTAHWRLRTYRDPRTGLLNLCYLRLQLTRRGKAARRTLLIAAQLVGLEDIEASDGAETAHGLLRRVGRAFREVVGHHGLLYYVGHGMFVATFLNGDTDTAIEVIRGFRVTVWDAHPALSILLGWAIAPTDGAELDDLLRIAFDRVRTYRKRKGESTRSLLAGDGTRR